MVELADIFRRYGPDYTDRFGSRMPPSHRRAIHDIVNCRTQVMGGHVYRCKNQDCCKKVYAYHSCGNRSCPQCGQDKTQRWLKAQKKLLLPTHYFLVTFTLPCELRPVARANQKIVYDLLFTSAAAALQKLAKDPRFIGGDIAMMGGLHTWRRDMRYHPHVHFIVPGGGLSADRTRWLACPPDFLVPAQAVSPIFRAKFRDGLKKTALFDSVPSVVWNKDWVVHCKPVGSGKAALKYLAPYVYRTAITNNRIEKLENDQVTFRFKESETKQWKKTTVPVLEFIWRFLQHVLPKNFVKIRYYGLLAPNNRRLLPLIRYLLGDTAHDEEQANAAEELLCPSCGCELVLVMEVPKSTRAPPW